jgi:hypothetical protein
MVIERGKNIGEGKWKYERMVGTLSALQRYIKRLVSA